MTESNIDVGPTHFQIIAERGHNEKSNVIVNYRLSTERDCRIWQLVISMAQFTTIVSGLLVENGFFIPFDSEFRPPSDSVISFNTKRIFSKLLLKNKIS